MNRYINALFTKHKKKRLPGRLQGTWFDEWMSYGYVTFATSFVLQGMLYANWRDNVVKIAIDVAIALPLCAVMPWWAGLLVAHAANYCLNGQAVCVFYHIRAGNLTARQFYDGTVAMKRRLDRCRWIDAAISYGSLSTGKWHPSSDIDIRFVPRKGELGSAALLRNSFALVFMCPRPLFTWLLAAFLLPLAGALLLPHSVPLLALLLIAASGLSAARGALPAVCEYIERK